MKKRFIVSLVILPFSLAFLSCGQGNDAVKAGTGAKAKTYTTTFTATENPISEGGVWIGPAASWTAVATSPGFAHGTQPGGAGFYADSYAFLSGFANDQQVDMVLHKNASEGKPEVEALLRFSKSGDTTSGYECNYNTGGGVQIVSWDGPFSTFHSLALGGAPIPETGDIFRAKISGNRIIVSTVRAGVETVAIDFTDVNALHPTGQPGMGFFVGVGQPNTSFGISQFTATDGVSIPIDNLTFGIQWPLAIVHSLRTRWQMAAHRAAGG
jgi:hypothetical protein